MIVNNTRANAELARIQWRTFIMSQPAGVEWLCKQLKNVRGNLCRAMSPPNINFDFSFEKA